MTLLFPIVMAGVIFSADPGGMVLEEPNDIVPVPVMEPSPVRNSDCASLNIKLFPPNASVPFRVMFLLAVSVVPEVLVI